MTLRSFFPLACAPLVLVACGGTPADDTNGPADQPAACSYDLDAIVTKGPDDCWAIDGKLKLFEATDGIAGTYTAGGATFYLAGELEQGALDFEMYGVDGSLLHGSAAMSGPSLTCDAPLQGTFTGPAPSDTGTLSGMSPATATTSCACRVTAKDPTTCASFCGAMTNAANGTAFELCVGGCTSSYGVACDGGMTEFLGSGC